MTSATKPPARRVNGSAATDLAALVLGVVAAVSVLQPFWAVRYGGIAALLALLLSVGRRRHLRRVDIAFAAYLMWSILSTAWTTTPEGTEATVWSLAGCFAIFVAIGMTVQRRREYVLVTVGLVVGCLTALARLVLAGAEVRLQYIATAERATIDGLNANYLAFSFLTAAFATVSVAALVKDPRVRLLAAAVVVALYAGVLINGTRAALVSFALLLVWFAVYRFWTRRAYAAAFGVMIFTWSATFAGWFDTFVRANITSSLRETGDLNGRLILWPIARQMFWDEPLLGHGAGSFRYSPENPTLIAAHSVFLDVGVGTGFVGILLFTWVLVEALRCSPTTRSVLLVKGAFIVTITPILATGFWIESPVFWISLALLTRIHLFSPPDEQESSPSRAQLTGRPSGGGG